MSENVPELRRFWFSVRAGIGIGVTASSLAEAHALAEEALAYLPDGASITHVIEDIDVDALDPRHVLPSMGSPAVYGIWFPRLNA